MDTTVLFKIVSLDGIAVNSVLELREYRIPYRILY